MTALRADAAEQPDLLRSAYLLRGKTTGSIDTAAPTTDLTQT